MATKTTIKAELTMVHMRLWKAKQGGHDFAIWCDYGDEEFPPYAFSARLKKGVVHRNDLLWISIPTDVVLDEWQWLQEKRNQLELKKSEHINNVINETVDSILALLQSRWHHASVLKAKILKQRPFVNILLGCIKKIEDGRGEQGCYIRRAKQQNMLLSMTCEPTKKEELLSLKALAKLALNSGGKMVVTASNVNVLGK